VCNSEAMSKEPVVDQAVNTLRRGLPIVQNGMQYTLDTAVSLLECGTDGLLILHNFD